MTIAVLGYALAAGALGALASWALATVFRMAGQPERWVWGAGLMLVGALSVAPFAVRALDGLGREAVAPGVYRVGWQLEFVAEEGPGEPAGRALFPVDGRTRIPYAAGLWLTLSTSLLGLGVVAELRHRRRTGRLRAVRMRGLDVWLSEREGPAVCGALAPRLVLPRRILELTSRDRALVLTHEAEHLRARDPQLNALAFLIVVAVPWNPFVWWLRRHVARAVEGDCDRRAVERRGVPAGEYVDVLLTVASWNLVPPAAPLRLAMGRSARDLRARVERLLRPTPPRKAGAIAGLVLIAVGAAAPLLADPPHPIAETSRIVEAGPVAGVLTARPLEEQGRDAAIVLPPPPDDAEARAASARAAFEVRWGAGGTVRSVTTEALRGTEAFESAATRWLGSARFGRGAGAADAPAGEGLARVWVAVEGGVWSAASISEALYEREGLAGRLDRTLDLVDAWARTDRSGASVGGALAIPTVSRVPRLQGAPGGGTAVLRERREGGS